MLVYGKNVALEYLTDGKKVRKVYLQEGFKDEKILFLVRKLNFPVIYKRKSDLDRLASGVHQGIILDVEDFSYCSFDSLSNE